MSGNAIAKGEAPLEGQRRLIDVGVAIGGVVIGGHATVYDTVSKGCITG